MEGRRTLYVGGHRYTHKQEPDRPDSMHEYEVSMEMRANIRAGRLIIRKLS